MIEITLTLTIEDVEKVVQTQETVWLPRGVHLHGLKFEDIVAPLFRTAPAQSPQDKYTHVQTRSRCFSQHRGFEGMKITIETNQEQQKQEVD